MLTRDIVVIGASAGGIRALQALARGLPPDLAAAVLVVQHVAPSSPGVLADILARVGPLPARLAVHGEQLMRGRIYVAPPDRHLLVSPELRAEVSRGPKENRTRPAIDPLFRSAAVAFGPRVIGVVLTGNLDDGTMGLKAVRLCGGLAVVQDPHDAEAASMPRSALESAGADHCLPVAEMGPLIARLVTEPIVPIELKMPDELEIEAAVARGDRDMRSEILSLGEPSPLTCPECHGVVVELRDKHPLHYRCHTGHAFTAESLLAALRERGEEAIWNAVRITQERTILTEHLARHARANGNASAANDLSAEAELAKQITDQLRRAHSQAS